MKIPEYFCDSTVRTEWNDVLSSLEETIISALTGTAHPPPPTTPPLDQPAGSEPDTHPQGGESQGGEFEYYTSAQAAAQLLGLQSPLPCPGTILQSLVEQTKDMEGKEENVMQPEQLHSQDSEFSQELYELLEKFYDDSPAEVKALSYPGDPQPIEVEPVWSSGSSEPEWGGVSVHDRKRKLDDSFVEEHMPCPKRPSDASMFPMAEPIYEIRRVPMVKILDTQWDWTGQTVRVHVPGYLTPCDVSVCDHCHLPQAFVLIPRPPLA